MYLIKWLVSVSKWIDIESNWIGIKSQACELKLNWNLCQYPALLNIHTHTVESVNTYQSVDKVTAEGESNYCKIYIAEHLWGFDLQIQKTNTWIKFPYNVCILKHIDSPQVSKVDTNQTWFTCVCSRDHYSSIYDELQNRNATEISICSLYNVVLILKCLTYNEWWPDNEKILIPDCQTESQ